MHKSTGSILIRPRVTEKSAIAAESQNAYVFEVSPKSTKKEIARAVKEIYKVDAKKVTIVKLPAKKVFTRGKRGMTSPVKKAYVYLNKGDKIELS